MSQKISRNHNVIFFFKSSIRAQNQTLLVLDEHLNLHS